MKNLKEHIGPHTLEVRYSGSGSLDPWTWEATEPYSIAFICTADVAEFFKFDGRIRRNDKYFLSEKELTEIIEKWKHEYNETPEKVEKELNEWVRGCSYRDEDWTTEELLTKMGIGHIIEKLHWIETNPEVFDRLSEKTIKNTKQLVGAMYNKYCYMPKQENDIYALDTILMDIEAPQVGLISVEVGAATIQWTINYLSGAKYITEVKPFNRDTIKEFVELIKKPWESKYKNGNTKKDRVDGETDSAKA